MTVANVAHYTESTIERHERLARLLTPDATPLRRTQCQKYFELSNVEIWQLGRSEYWCVWNIKGYYYGLQASYCSYRGACELRDLLLKLANQKLLSESGVTF